MTAGNEKGGQKLVWEPPQLMRLTAPGDALGGGCGSGSGDSYCSPGTGALTTCINSGSDGPPPT